MLPEENAMRELVTNPFGDGPGTAEDSAKVRVKDNVYKIGVVLFAVCYANLLRWLLDIIYTLFLTLASFQR